MEPSSAQVTATALGEWPGTDPLEATRVVRGELGDPHLPHLVSLPGRGVGSDAVGRTAAILVELPVDVQPHGWRLVDRPGKDHRRAVSALSTDLNVLGDVIGAESEPAPALKIHLRGPLSLAANLHLHSGERALLDVGARREIRDSLAAGAADLVSRVRSAASGALVQVQLDEPEIAFVLAGGVPTASGYRTLRAVPDQEAADAWDTVAEAVRAAGGGTVAVSFPAERAPLDVLATSSITAVALPLAGLSMAQWESLAGQLEAGGELWAGIMPDPRAVPTVSALAGAVLSPWRMLGLPLNRLAQLRLTPDTGLAGVSPAAAANILRRLTQTADALNQEMAND
ncbi:uroporphyrinogen decarboxylase/cobalamine-independent methonine synthase family protein [Arthrobacter sp. TMT4-20]